MVKYILKRLVQLVVVLLGVTFLTFMITQAAPSDAAEMKYVSMGMMPSSELLEKTREEMGLNDPVLIQYGRGFGMPWLSIQRAGLSSCAVCLSVAVCWEQLCFTTKWAIRFTVSIRILIFR